MPNKKWRVVVNCTYRHIIWKMTATKDKYLNADEKATWETAIEQITKDDPLGDVLEIGVALAMFNNEPQDIVMLMEAVFYLVNSVDDHWNEDRSKQYKATQLLALVRTWASGRVEERQVAPTDPNATVLRAQMSDEIEDPLGAFDLPPRAASSGGTVVGEAGGSDRSSGTVVGEAGRAQAQGELTSVYS